MLTELLLFISGKKESAQVEELRVSWDRIAEKLRKERYPVWVRLNAEEERAEFCVHSSTVFASVRLQGADGYPHRALVVSPQPLPQVLKLAFERELSALVAVEFKTGV